MKNCFHEGMGKAHRIFRETPKLIGTQRAPNIQGNLAVFNQLIKQPVQHKHSFIPYFHV